MSLVFGGNTLKCLERPMRFACSTCGRTTSLALLLTGSIALAFAGFYLAYAAREDWNHGWIAGLIGVALFCTAPAIVALVIQDFRSPYSGVSLTKRFARAGIALICFGVLEFALAFASWIFLSVVTPGAVFS
jgi:hypothetical protein